MIKLVSFVKSNNLSKEDYKKIDVLNEKLKHNPDNLELLMQKATIYADGYDNENTFTTYQKIIELYPKYVDTYLWLAYYVYFAICGFKEAIEIANEGLKVDPNRADLYMIIAWSKENLSETKDTILYHYKKSIILDPSLISSRISLIEFLIKIKQFDQAKKEITEAFKHIQDNFPIPNDSIQENYEHCISGRGHPEENRKTLQEYLNKIAKIEAKNPKVKT